MIEHTMWTSNIVLAEIVWRPPHFWAISLVILAMYIQQTGRMCLSFFYNIGDWPNSLDCTDLNQCGARRDAVLCRLCYIHTYKISRDSILNFSRQIFQWETEIICI